MPRSLVMLPLAALLLIGCVEATEPPHPSLLPSPAPTAPSSSPSAAPTVATPSGTPPSLSVDPVLEGLTDPLDIAWRPDDPETLFVVEQVGRVRIVREDRLVERPFLDISGLVRAGGESGLLGLAFLPSGEAGRFFVYYTNDAGRQVVASYDIDPNDPDVAAPGTATVWLDMAD
ncbi:MAG TPA: PQQ-dependent sugar dehydrogenase, partial [Candidatus Limnocylindrales bacterium]|nr:PQQ-dependent sugar dehydrogenase [Candidatus Limnocylindrales bacterium]